MLRNLLSKTQEAVDGLFCGLDVSMDETAVSSNLLTYLLNRRLQLLRAIALRRKYSQGIFGWGSWKLFELSPSRRQPNCGCLWMGSERMGPVRNTLDGRAHV